MFSPLAEAAPAACEFDKSQSIQIPLVAPSEDHVVKGYSVQISIGEKGPPHIVEVDTGSTGIVVPQSAVTEAVWKNATRPGHMLYNSDDLYLHGKYARVSVTLGVPKDYAGTGAFPSTTPLDVLVVDCRCSINRTATAPKASNPLEPSQCSSLNGTRASQDQPSPVLEGCHSSTGGWGMMGVGFARGTNPSSNNPFLHLTAMDAGTMHPGYIIGQHGIELGLTAKNTKDFRFVQLQPSQITPASPYVKEWLEPQVCVSLPTAQPKPANLCGGLLMDTGITYMMLTVPSAQRPTNLVTTSSSYPGEIVPAGTPMTVTVSGAKEPVLTYPVNDPKHLAPSPEYVSWRGANGNGVYVNTGRHALAAADYAYDAECGRLGFWPISANNPGAKSAQPPSR